MSSGIYEGAKQLKEATDVINKAKSVVEKIDKGEKPGLDRFGSDWRTLADHYKETSIIVSQAELPSEFDKSQYEIPASDLKDCSKKEEVMVKLQNYLDDIDKANVEAEKNLIVLKDMQKEVAATKKALKYLIEVQLKLAYIQTYNEVFHADWEWLALEQGVKPELAELDKAIKKQIDRFTEDFNKSKNQKNNLSNNLKLLKKSWCSFAGVYKGMCETGFEYTLNIQESLGSYSGYAIARDPSVDNTYPADPISNFSFDDKNFSFITSKTTNGYTSTFNWIGTVNSAFSKIIVKINGHPATLLRKK